MILDLYIFLFLVAIVLVILGIVRQHEAYLGIVGFVLLFIISVLMLNGSVDVPSGFVVNSSIAGSTEIHYVYSSFHDSTSYWFGYLLAIFSVCGCGLLMLSARSRRGD